MRHGAIIFVLILGLLSFNSSQIFACAQGEADCSSSYGVIQPSFSSGSSQNLQSNNYSASGTAGDLNVGNESSKNFQAYTGFNTSDVPYLQLLATNPNVCSGTLTPATYYFKVTALDVNGVESLPSTEQSTTITSTQTCIAVTWSTLGDGYDYRVYFATTSGAENQYYQTSNNTYTLSQPTGGVAATPPATSTSLAKAPAISTVTGVNQIGSSGVLSTTSISTATSTFSIRCWVCDGYAITYSGGTPTNGTYYLNSFLGTFTYYSGSQPTTSEFGINLAVNPTAGVGTAPTSPTLPSTGVVASSYNSADTFLYNPGDEIAYSQSSTSITTFTISYLFRIRVQTPPGQYNFNQSLIATGTY
jgi:hypothetical protein